MNIYCWPAAVISYMCILKKTHTIQMTDDEWKYSRKLFWPIVRVFSDIDEQETNFFLFSSHAQRTELFLLLLFSFLSVRSFALSLFFLLNDRHTHIRESAGVGQNEMNTMTICWKIYFCFFLLNENKQKKRKIPKQLVDQDSFSPETKFDHYHVREILSKYLIVYKTRNLSFSQHIRKQKFYL